MRSSERRVTSSAETSPRATRPARSGMDRSRISERVMSSLVDEGRDREAVLRHARRLAQREIVREARMRLVRAERETLDLHVRRGRDAGHVELLELLHVREDAAELAGHSVELVVAQIEM